MRSALATVLTLALTLVLVQAGSTPAAADYLGPIVDGNSHLPNAAAIDAYVAAMRRHNVTRVVLLGIGSAQPDEAAWIDAAAQKYPALVVAGLRVPDPLNKAEAGRLDVELARTKARVMGEVHIRHATRKLDRDPSAPGFLKILELTAQRGVPVVIHDELTPAAAASLEAALAAHRQAIIVLAHAGKSSPAVLEPLLARNANLKIDLSGMNFQSTPALAKEKGPLDPKWKALITKRPDRFLIGLNVGAAKHFEAPTLDRVMSWTRRILGELPPAVAERVAWQNATRLYHLD
jgi:predicted TIM-barrel fold metal-dependent hydrolase